MYDNLSVVVCTVIPVLAIGVIVAAPKFLSRHYRPRIIAWSVTLLVAGYTIISVITMGFGLAYLARLIDFDRQGAFYLGAGALLVFLVNLALVAGGLFTSHIDSKMDQAAAGRDRATAEIERIESEMRARGIPVNESLTLSDSSKPSADDYRLTGSPRPATASKRQGRR